MTVRSRFLSILGVLGICLGAIRGQYLLALVSFSVLIWIFAEWLRFQSSLYIRLPRISFQRTINGQSALNGTLYCGRQVQIAIQIRSPRALRINLLVRDFVPELVEILGHQASSGVSSQFSSPTTKPPNAGQTQTPSNKKGIKFLGTDWPSLLALPNPLPSMPHELLVENGTTTADLNYRVLTRAAGKLTLPGLRLTLEDRYGFFRAHRFVDLPQVYRVLPAYYESGEFQPQVKRHNSLPRHGIHRLQRSGMGSELLELRDYVVGDPPKSIAWKVSARRDRLLTRQYESEVPVKIHLIVDGSNPTRLGGYGLRLLDQINYVTASVAKAALAVGDPVDCCLVDETSVKRLPTFSGDRGFLELLKALADFSLKAPPTTNVLTPAMRSTALVACYERYPELFDNEFSRIPFSFSMARRRRWRLVNVVAEIFGLSPREQVACMVSDDVLATYLQQLLHDIGMPWMSPIVPAPDEPQRSAARRMSAISDCMLRSILNAHDNEVFVILADLISSAPNLHSLQRTIKLAIAKHHRVAFVCPTTTFERPKPEAIIPGSEDIGDLIWAAERSRVRDLAFEMKRELLKLGSVISFSGEQSAIRMVLAEMDTARHGRRRQSGVAR